MATNLFATLTELKRYKRKQVAFREFCQFIIVNVVFMAASFMLDNLTNLSVASRLSALVLLIIINLVLLVKLSIRLYRSKMTDREAALELEAEFRIRDNSMVNAVCFARDENMAEPLKNMFMKLADSRCHKMRFRAVLKNKQCAKAFWSLILVIVGGLLYFIPFHQYAGNACLRLLDPWSQLASLNFTQFIVTPGDTVVRQGQSLNITAAAFRNGKQRNNLKVIIHDKGGAVLYRMGHRNGKSAFTVKSVVSDLSYSITNGNDSSRLFRVKMLNKPQLESLNIVVTPPAYTRQAKQTYSIKASHIEAVVGSTITLAPKAPDGFSFSWQGIDARKDQPASFQLKKNASVAIDLSEHTEDFVENTWNCKFKAISDKAPNVRFLNQNLNIEAGFGQTVPIYFLADDDYGITRLTVSVKVKGKRFQVKEFRYDDSLPKVAKEVFPLKITPELFPANSSGEVRITALDSHQPALKGQTQVPITIHIVDLVDKLKNQLDRGKAAKLYELLFRILEGQQKTRNWVSEKVKNYRRREAKKLNREQKEIVTLFNSAVKVAGVLLKEQQVKKAFVNAIVYLKSKPATVLVTQTGQLLDKRLNKQEIRQKLNEIMTVQTDLISKLQELLGAMAVENEKEKQLAELAKEEEQEKEFYDKLKNLKDKMEEFKKSQRDIVNKTEAIDPKDAEDWSEDEEKLLGELAAREMDWAKFFKAAFNDLSKLQNQDFSNSAMADEFIEMYEELQKAGDALKKKKNIEIATLAENTAMDSAKAVEANLDRWLADTPDNIKWNAEEDGAMPDTPLTDLPDELTDIIGDLIETEDDMDEESQDSTNSFTYSSDEGLGWGVSDGNIDSMQAKGITGNVLPNNNEVGGRSGEGRSGKSSGQFVEKEALGKGGRKTPTRLTQSPYEKGTVVDKSKDAQGGASGGGKQSGVGDEGLVGVTPDQDNNIGQRLAGQQGELKQRSKALLKKLSDKHLPTGDVRDALRKMTELDRLNDKTDGVKIRRVKSEIVAALRNARTAIDTASKAEKEHVKRKKRKAYTISYQQKEKVPDGYEDIVGRYFKALAADDM